MTHIVMRNKLKEVDLDADGCMSMIEFLLCKNDAQHFDGACFNFDEMMKRPQGTNEALERAMAEVAKLIKQGEDDVAHEKQLEKNVEDTKGSAVKHPRAKNILSQWHARDPLPYNKAILSAKAQVN